MLKRLSMVAVLALTGLLAACTNPSSPGATTPASVPAVESPSTPAESPSESPAAS